MGVFQMPPGFWETKERNRAVMMYPFAPFLEEAGILLRAARRLWHPWSVKRLKELEEIASNLEGHAKMLRQRGLTWSGTILPLDSGLSPEFIISNAVWWRYHHDKNDPKDACPLIVSHLVSSATRILFFLLPIFEKIEKAEWSEHGHHVARLKQRIEILMESPYIGSFPEIPDDAFKALGVHALLIECEGLAFMQARIEQTCSFRSEKPKRKKVSAFSDAELRKLAGDMDVEFDILKEAFESESSPWWNRASEFSRQAQRQKEIFLSLLGLNDEMRQMATSVFDDGMSTNEFHPSYIREEDCVKTGYIVNLFITRLLVLANRNDATFQTDALLRGSRRALPAPTKTQ